jgi:hypothetical protein
MVLPTSRPFQIRAIEPPIQSTRDDTADGDSNIGQPLIGDGTLNLIGGAMEGITRQQRNLSMEMWYVWCCRHHDLSKSAH